MMNRSVVGRAFTLVVAGVAALGAATGCVGDLFQDDCASDSDCPSGLSCNHALLRQVCEKPCSTHSECPADSYCDQSSWFSGFPHCSKGCRADSQCSDGSVCSGGACDKGCHEDTQCAKGKACFQPEGVSIGTDVGSCKSGCRDDSECGSGQHCLCHSCTTGCRTNDDCGAGRFCNVSASPVCKASQCEALPPAVTCGSSTCDGRGLLLQLTSNTVAIAPCCTPEGACGADVGALMKSSVACQAPATDGVSDPSCPLAATSEGAGLPPCRRPDGGCGVLVADIRGTESLGCLVP